MPAFIDHYALVGAGKRESLEVPDIAIGGEGVKEDERTPVTIGLVIDVDPTTVDIRHNNLLFGKHGNAALPYHIWSTAAKPEDRMTAWILASAPSLLLRVFQDNL